jgi:hypothetical protein
MDDDVKRFGSPSSSIKEMERKLKCIASPLASKYN